MKLTRMTDLAYKYAIAIFAVLSFFCCFANMTGYIISELLVVLIALVLVCVVGVVLICLRRLSYKQLLLLIFLVGFLLRLVYIIYSPYSERQHDVQTIAHSNGHMGYILHFVNNGFRLYDGDPTEVYAFYNPPLWHFIAASFVKLGELVGLSLERCAETLQCVSLFISTCCTLVAHKIFVKLGIRGKALVAVTALVCFHPTFYLFAGSLNNDPLSLLLLLVAVLATLEWYDEPTLPRILAVAVSLGLAMMTKLSAGLVAPAIALIFLVKLIQRRKERPIKLIGQFAAFGAVCAPLGLWWPIRCLVMYGMPLTYVPLITDTAQYVGDVPLVSRLFGLQFRFPFVCIPYHNNFAEYGEHTEFNVFISLFKTSVFGEYTFKNNYLQVMLCYILLWVNIAIALFAVYSIFAVLIRTFKKKEVKSSLFRSSLAVLYLTLMASQIKFSFDYPHVCTMNFRYIVSTLIVGAAFIGLYFTEMKQTPFARVFKGFSALTGALFCSLGAAVYLFLSGLSSALIYVAIIACALVIFSAFLGARNTADDTDKL